MADQVTKPPAVHRHLHCKHLELLFTDQQWRAWQVLAGGQHTLVRWEFDVVWKGSRSAERVALASRPFDRDAETGGAVSHQAS